MCIDFRKIDLSRINRELNKEVAKTTDPILGQNHHSQGNGQVFQVDMVILSTSHCSSLSEQFLAGQG